MGMFNYVAFQTRCPSCNCVLDSFQSKDGSCTMDIVPYWEVDHFYTMCDNCRTWISFTRKRPVGKPYVPISDYDLEYHKIEEENK